MNKKTLEFNLERELVLLKQLSAHIKEEDLSFRPVPEVRSSYELMQYLSNIGAVMMRWLIKNDITKEDWLSIREDRKSLNLENFKARLDKQFEDIKRYLAEVSEEDLLNKEVELPNKERMPLGQAIINAPIKWLAVYRMELFLYLKMCGKKELGTRDAWTV